MSNTPPPASSGPSPGPSDEIGDLSSRRLGDFQLIRRLGHGAMAEVYLAEQVSMKRPVAIKVLRPEFIKDETYVKRFQQEARAAGSLNHPNIVLVYIIGEADGYHFIAQEYVQGRNLKEFLVRKGALEVPLALNLMRQIASALQAAGQAGIVHRDIKPENIMLTRKGEAKVADFGLAQLTQQGEKVALTQVGVTMGTPLYMSPEQVHGKTLDPRSDLYAFGVMCYHMLAGRPPFTGETAISVAVKHLNEEAEPLDRVRADLPAGLVNLVRRMMAKKKEDRPADAQEILNELKVIGKQWAARSQSGVKIPVVPPPRKSRLSRQVRRQLALFVLAALAVGGGSAGIGWAMRVGDPFKTPAPPSSVPKQESAQAQFYYALSKGYDEAAWRAVVDYFPDATLERQRAYEQLAIIYLKTDRLAQADEIYSRFIADGESDPELKAQGLAGKAVVLSLQGRSAESRQYVADFETLRRKAPPELARLLLDAEARNRSAGTP